MPNRSEAQRGLMAAAASGKKWATRKVPQSVAQEFMDSDEGGKLPEHVPSSRAEKAKKRYPHQAKD